MLFLLQYCIQYSVRTVSYLFNARNRVCRQRTFDNYGGCFDNLVKKDIRVTNVVAFSNEEGAFLDIEVEPPFWQKLVQKPPHSTQSTVGRCL